MPATMAPMHNSSVLTSTPVPTGWGVAPSGNAPTRPLVQRRTALLTHSELQQDFLLNNIVLLLVACVGAFILLAVNLIGVVCFRGYFKKRARASPYIDCPQSLSHVRRSRYATLLQHFSDDGQPNIELVPIRHHALMAPLSSSMQTKDYVSRRTVSFAVPSTITASVQRSHSHTDQLKDANSGTETDNTDKMNSQNSLSVLPQRSSLSCRELSHVASTQN